MSKRSKSENGVSSKRNMELNTGSGLLFIVLTGTMTSLILVYFIITALVIGLAILFAELSQDPDQFWEEKGQITAIIGLAISPLGGLGVIAPAGLEALMLQIVTTILAVVGTV